MAGCCHTPIPALEQSILSAYPLSMMHSNRYGGGGKTVLTTTVIPGVGYLAYGQDTEGNTFGMMQADPSAN
jgi:hypothetical protein